MSETPPPAKKRSTLASGCLIILGVIVGLAILGAIIGPKDGTKGGDATASNAPPADAAATATRVTAVELVNAYEANEAAAQMQYGDKPLLVTGTIDDITLDIANDPVVKLEGGEMFTHASVNDLPSSVAAELTKGQRITVLCASVMEVIGNPQLSDCTIQP